MKKAVTIGLKVFLFLVFQANVFAQESDMDSGLAGNTVTKSFGSFSLPEDWTEITRYSRNEKYFYSHKSEQVGSRMTNVSIEMGRNPYAAEDHASFRYAILRQLLMQAGGSKGEVHGDGTFTKQNDVLYIFTISIKEPPVTTTQYYIIGDKKHILVHLTDYHNGNIANAEEAARFIADSFVWPE